MQETTLSGLERVVFVLQKEKDRLFQIHDRSKIERNNRFKI